MKILHIAAHLGGGAGKAILGSISDTIKDYEQKIILLDVPERLDIIQKVKGKKVEIIIAPSHGELKKEIENADIVVLNWWNHPIVVKVLKIFNFAKCRLVLWAHINGCTYPYLPYEFLNMFNWIMFTTSFSWENPYWSEEERKQIRDKSVLVYGMGDFNPQTFRLKNYISREQFIIGYVGTLSYSKINRKFVEYCERVSELVTEVQFVLVGDMCEDLYEDIEKSSISDKFLLIGHATDVEKYYHMFDVLGYLLNEDNYGTTENVLLEAMACGVPIIVLNNKVENHIVFSNENGYCINGIDEYVQKILYLKQNQNVRSKIGKKAREYVINTYQRQNNNHIMYKVYDIVYKIPKVCYNFNNKIGATAFEQFLYFAGKDGKCFENYIKDASKNSIIDCKDIFKGYTKGSVNHFAQYFSESKELSEINKILKMHK